MDIGQRLDEIMQPPTDRLVRAYFDLNNGFAGVTFDGLGRKQVGVDNPTTRDHFTTDDLLAVTLLDVRTGSRPPREDFWTIREESSRRCLRLFPVSTSGRP